MNILIIEDVEELQFVYKNFLKEHNCFFCDTEKMMYEILEQNRVDLIITDIGLPGSKSGLDLIKDLKSSERYKDIPIISSTVHIDKKELSLDFGADYFILKPFTKQSILAAIKLFDKD